MELIALTFVLTFGFGILSGMAGGGAGFVVMPYYLAIGLPPAHALATAKFGAIGTSVGSLSAFRGKGLVDKKFIAPFMMITLVCAIVSAVLIPKIDAGVFEKVIGWALLLLVPTLFIDKGALKSGDRSRPWIVAGFILFTIFSFAQTLIGAGMGTIVVLIFMYLFGLDALRASAAKRVSQSVQAVVLFILLAVQGFVVWSHGIAGVTGAVVGTHIGTKFAIKRGVNFVKFILATVMIISGVGLIFF